MATNPNDMQFGNYDPSSLGRQNQATQDAVMSRSQQAATYDKSGTNPLTGFASQYNPTALSQTIFQNPWAILPDVFKGINMQGPGYAMMRDIGADPLTLYQIMQGAHGRDFYGRAGGTGAGDYTNWLAKLITDFSTPQTQGGAGRDFSGYELLRNVFQADPKSSLGGLMTAGNQSAQARSPQNILNAASSVGINPLSQFVAHITLRLVPGQRQAVVKNGSRQGVANDFGFGSIGRQALQQSPNLAFHRYGQQIGMPDVKSAFGRWFHQQYPAFGPHFSYPQHCPASSSQAFGDIGQSRARPLNSDGDVTQANLATFPLRRCYAHDAWAMYRERWMTMRTQVRSE